MNDDDLPLGLYGHSMVIIEDILYIIGGTTGLTYHSRVYSIDLKKLDKWTLRFVSILACILVVERQGQIYHDWMKILMNLR